MSYRPLLSRLLTNAAPVPYVPRSNSSANAWSWATRTRGSTEHQLDAMGSVGTLFQIVHRLSNATSQVEWKLWRKSASGKDEDRKQVLRHAALTVWNAPNRFYTRQELVETCQQHIDLVGEGYFVVVRALNFPIELWPVRPDRMTPVPDRANFLAGYVYQSPDGEKIPLNLDQVIQLKMPNPTNPYRGMGPVQAILTDLDSTRYSAEWNRQFFLNSAQPGGIIEVPEGLSDTDFDTLQARWNEQHRGVGNAHRVAIIEHGTWKDRNISQQDMQFVELRNVNRDIIREAFGIHKVMLGVSDDVNRANAQTGEEAFARWHLVPRLERIKGALNNDFLPMFGGSQNLEFDYENPVPESIEQTNAKWAAQADFLQKTSSVIELSDALTYLGMPPMKAAPEPTQPEPQNQPQPQDQQDAMMGAGQ